MLTDPGCSEPVREVGAFSQDTAKHMATGDAVEFILFKELSGICPFGEGLRCLGARSRAEFNRNLAGGKRSWRRTLPKGTDRIGRP